MKLLSQLQPNKGASRWFLFASSFFVLVFFLTTSTVSLTKNIELTSAYKLSQSLPSDSDFGTLEYSCDTRDIARGILLQQNSSSSTVDYWQSLTKACPDSLFASVRAGESAMEQGQVDLAIKSWQSSPQIFNYVLGKLMSLSKQNDWNSAAILASVLTELSPERYEGFFFRGQAGLVSGNWLQAAEDFEQASTLSTNSETVTSVERAEIFQYLGRVYRYLNQTDKSIAALNSAVEMDPLNSMVYVELAGLELSNNNNLEKAQLYARKSIEVDPSNVWAHLTLGRIELESGNYERAVELGQSALQLQPASEQPYLLLAQTMEAMGSIPEAFQYIDSGIARTPQKTNLLCYRWQLANRENNQLWVTQTATQMSLYNVNPTVCVP
jgi:tetratricopeptide (TPR) repeat protein